MATNNNTLPFTEYRNGNTPLVFLHGLMEDARMWADFLSDLPFRCIAMDLPGYGKAQDKSFESVSAAAAAVHETIQDLELQNFILIGHSMGGYVGLSYLNQFPSSLMGLGMIHAHPFADSEEKRAERDKAIQFIEKFGLGIYAQQFFPSLFARSYKDNLAIHTLSLRSTQLNQERIIESIRSLKHRPDLTKTVIENALPTLWVLGTEDKLVDLDRTAEVAAKSDQTQIEIYENVGHMSMFEHTKVLRKDLIRFVRFCEQVGLASD
ncbi:MAG: alpha/beta fold hydrolase [Bacteroidetes bacterium]|jgi:pimeloyl-ACP methyl ester carboxylesterase|nr:alpha/beta fold hydrolase [Bacteroidota bacterium]